MKKFMRKWQVIDQLETRSMFTVMSYNILAQSNLSHHFRQHNSNIMNKQNRHSLIRDKIKNVNPDVCLIQEMDTPDLENFKSFFNEFQMDSFFQKKSNEDKHDGTFIAYNRDKFEQVSYWYFDCFFQNDYNYNKVDLLEKEMWYSTNVQFMLLNHKHTKKKILFINSHLPYNRRKGHVKLAIIYIVYQIMDQIKDEYGFETAIWGGDFNTIPFSMLYDLLTKGELNLQANLAEYSNLLYSQMLKEQGLDLELISELCNAEWKKPQQIYKEQDYINYEFLKQLMCTNIDIKDKHIQFKSNYQDYQNIDNQQVEKTLQQFFKNKTFNSTYSILKQKINFKENSNQDILFSHYTTKFIAPVDYLFFSNKKLQVAEILLAPPINYMKELKYSLPCDIFGSDHISIAAKYILNQLIQSFMKPY